MTYAVDLMRSVYYLGREEYTKVVLTNSYINLLIIAGMFTFFLLLGTFLFVRKERNR